MVNTTADIEFYLDFTSPYAYLASTQIEALAAKHNRNVIWRPFLIGATFKVTGRGAPIGQPLVKEYTLNDVQRYARLLDQPINFPIKFPILGVKPSRLFYFLESRDNNQKAAIAFAKAAFLAYFVRLMFGIGSGSPGLNAIASSIGALIIVPTHWRRR